MIKYLSYKGREIPFLITFSTLIEFEELTGKDFMEIFNSGANVITLAKHFRLIAKLGIKTAYAQKKPNVFKRLWNVITTGHWIGLKDEDYAHIRDQQWTELISLIPTFFYDITNQSEEKSAEIINDLKNEKKKKKRLRNS